MERQERDLLNLANDLKEDLFNKSNRLGGGLARPDKDLLALQVRRERLIVARQFKDIEPIEKEIALMKEKIRAE